MEESPYPVPVVRELQLGRDPSENNRPVGCNPKSVSSSTDEDTAVLPKGDVKGREFNVRDEAQVIEREIDVHQGSFGRDQVSPTQFFSQTEIHTFLTQYCDLLDLNF